MRIRPLMASLALAGTCTIAHAQTGVSDDRVSLPDGPGSLEGIGENVSLDPNMGVMRYGVPIDVPRGFAGVTPNLRLGYSSGGGSSVVGVGWDLAIPHIERRTARGLPRYTADDEFSADGGTQLVRVAEGATPTYRARFEGGFVRYTWHEVGDGAEGYWLAEYPNGRLATFGATADGTLVPSARVSGPDGTFRYMVVDVIDVHGHRLHHTYQSIDGYALIRQMDYVFTDGDPQYSVSFGYEDRADDTGVDVLSDAKAGFDERLTQRLAAINVFSGENRIRRYELDYERYGDSGGFTRLSAVRKLGLDGSVYPAVQRFTWSRTLEGVCAEGDDCEKPFVIDMGNIGVNIGVGRATLVDINGDALPDLVDTSDDGAHKFLLNLPSVDGRMRFSDQPVSSAVGVGSGFRLGTPFVQVLDVNGDGYADLLDARNGRALLNDGGGDWAALVDLADTAAVGDALGADFDAGEGGLRTLRFVDMDNDKRIDMLRSTREGTRLYRNTGEGFEVVDAVDPLGYDLAVDGIEMSDMNGDGLLDAVKLNVGGLRYRLNLGHGRWGDEVEVLGLPIDESELDLASLDDLNGDGLSDLVVVVGRQIKYAINRNGTTFSQIATLDSADVDGELPLRDATVNVIMADVNGNGSTDVVWLDAQGQVTALELFPVRPNQLSRVENSLGMVTDIAYTTSVQEMARDGDWAYTLPHPMLVVERIERSDRQTGVREVTRYRYRDGFYDGTEKQFRGFGQVEVTVDGDSNQEEAHTTTTYDVGAEDRYRHGLMLTREVRSADRLINSLENEYVDCPLEAVPETDPPIRYLCAAGTTTVIAEGAPAAEHVTLRQEFTYDGFGNVTLSANLGVVARGGSDCGAECTGDESFTETRFIAPGANTDGRWILGAPLSMATFGEPQSDERTEATFFYDGPAFEGLPAGQLTKGLPTRLTEKVNVGDDAVIESYRLRRDDHGNVVERLDPLAEIGGDTHRSTFELDADGLRITRVARHLVDPEGAPYQLVQELRYEPVFDNIVEATDWMRADANGAPISARRSTTYTYDTFNRLLSTVRPGDTVDAPTSTYEYLLSEDITRIIYRGRTASGGPLDQEIITCLDGRGRTLQTRTRLDADTFDVSGFNAYTVQSLPLRLYQPYRSGSAECDAAPPADTRFVEFRYDGTGRDLEVVLPDAELHGTASVSRSEYRPLGVTRFDPEDADPNSPHADTPVSIETDGLGRVITLERRLADGQIARTRNVYDAIGRLHEAVDTDGNVKRQFYDLVGRVVRVEDPNKAGPTTMAYDDQGNLVRVEDGRGAVVRHAFDGMNRLIERWDDADRDGTLETFVWDHDPACDPAFCTNTAALPVAMTAPGLSTERNVDRFGYDARGNQIKAERIIEGLALNFETTYDNLDRPVTQTFPNGERITFRFDAASRPIAVDGFVEHVEYGERGTPDAIELTNGVRSETAYDAVLRLAKRDVLGPDGSPLMALDYARDRTGNLISVTDRASRLPRAETYEYDALYRTLRTAGGDGDVLSQTYALNDNVLSRSSTNRAPGVLTGDYEYTGAGVNALTAVGDVRFAYDDAGFTTQRGAQRLDWDAMGRLRAVTTDTDTIAEYAYGASHRRLVRREGDSQTLYADTQFELRDGISTLYVMLGGTRVARVEDDSLAALALSDLAPQGDLDGRITAADAWMALGAEAGRLEVDVAPSAAGALLNSAVRRMFVEQNDTVFLHRDHLGSIVMATDAEGEVVGERVFLQTGVERQDSVGYVDEYGYTGQEHDRAAGLIHYEHRMLDPQTGRWLSADPRFLVARAADLLSPADALNVYNLVRNSYANLVDPDGLDPKAPKQGEANTTQKAQGTANKSKEKLKATAKKVGKAICDGCKAAGSLAKKAAKNTTSATKAGAKKVCQGCKTAKDVTKAIFTDVDTVNFDFKNKDLGALATMKEQATKNVAYYRDPKRIKRLTQAKYTFDAVKAGVEFGVGAAELSVGDVFGLIEVGKSAFDMVVAVKDLAAVTKLDPTNPDDAKTLAENAPDLLKHMEKYHAKRLDAINQAIRFQIIGD